MTQHQPKIIQCWWQVDVLNSAPPWQKLRLMPVLCMIFITAIYSLRVAPRLPWMTWWLDDLDDVADVLCRVGFYGKGEDGVEDAGFCGKAEWEVGFSPENDGSYGPRIGFFLQIILDNPSNCSRRMVLLPYINLQTRSQSKSHRDPMIVLMELDSSWLIDSMVSMCFHSQLNQTISIINQLG